jgi:hypothetical protein
MSKQARREMVARMIAPAMRWTGFRFTKEYRQADFGVKAFIYEHVDTVLANYKAGSSVCSD